MKGKTLSAKLLQPWNWMHIHRNSSVKAVAQHAWETIWKWKKACPRTTEPWSFNPEYNFHILGDSSHTVSEVEQYNLCKKRNDYHFK